MLDTILAVKYGLTNVNLTPAPRGFVAETYYVDTDSKRYFLKILKSSFDDLSLIAPSLAVLQELHQMGVEQITYPIPTIDGQLSIPFNGGIFVLLSYVEGKWVFDFPFEPYVRLLAEIHRLSDRIQTPVPRERYDVAILDDMQAFCEQLWTNTFDHPQEKAMAQWAVERRRDLQIYMNTFEQTAIQLQNSERTFVLTHGDAAGNILYDGKQVSLVDWDTALFAPRERDTWFHRYDENFLPLYRQFMPEYKFDPTTYRFYLYKRYVEDAVGFFDKVLSSTSTDVEKADNFQEHIKTCDEWLQPLMEREHQE